MIFVFGSGIAARRIIVCSRFRCLEALARPAHSEHLARPVGEDSCADEPRGATIATPGHTDVRPDGDGGLSPLESTKLTYAAMCAINSLTCRGTTTRSGQARRSFRRRSNCAFAATMIVDILIAIAPTLMGKSMPHLMNSPAATGIATRL